MPPQNPEQASWFASEVQPHETALRAYLRERFPTLIDIDDLVQDSYARMMRAWDAGKISKPKAYLFATARNLARDLFRRRQVVSIEALADLEPLFVIEDGPDAAECASHAQELEILSHAIDALPARCREILTRRRILGHSHRQIARNLGISEHTVNAQLAIGLLRCRAYLRARGVIKRTGI
ncbi:MAG: RNA polymerase sigma factor [Opitutus sp.]